MKPADAKTAIIRYVQEGKTVAQAMHLVGKSEKTYEYYRSSDKAFCDSIDQVRAVRGRKGAAMDAGSFEEFCPKYLGQEVFAHQMQWIDLIEGRAPRDVHPSMNFQPGRQELLVVNTPPEHAKSTTITTNYVTYRICKDPNVRIIIVSKTKDMAKQFLYAIKSRLTHPQFQKLQVDFAPVDGFKASADAWTTDMVYLGQDSRDSLEKDPTLRALGIGGQIYGSRADLIILDDCVVLSNAHEYEKQINWISQEVLTRLADDGKLLIVGTRVAPQDLYSELFDPNRWPEGECDYTYFSQPAVLEFADDPKDWVTLWPKSNQPTSGSQQPLPDGFYPKWDGPALARRRRVIPPRTWAMVYMQQQVTEDAIFHPEAVGASINGQRIVGPLIKGAKGHRPEGMEGLYVIGGLDPATTGHTGAVVVAVDRTTRKRYVLDVFNQPGMTPGKLRQLVFDWTDKYKIHEWRIEKTGLLTLFTQDEILLQGLRERGTLMKEHYTGSNKWDDSFGVASMALLFDGWENGNQLIELPSPKQGEAVKQFVQQLVTWHPDTKDKTDIVMALWFAEICAREKCDRPKGSGYFGRNSYLGERQRNQQVVINIDDYFASRVS